MPPIYHLCVGNYVFKNEGYCNTKYPNKYVYKITSNYDIYKVNGLTTAGYLVIDKNNYQLYDMENFVELNQLTEPIRLLVNNYRKNLN